WGFGAARRRDWGGGGGCGGARPGLGGPAQRGRNPRSSVAMGADLKGRHPRYSLAMGTAPKGREPRYSLAMRAILSSIALAAACGGALPKTPAFVAQPGDVAIVHANVVPMDRDGVLADHAVVVRAERILAVAPSDAVELPPTARRIDAAGRHAPPRLADLAAHALP